jgi:hypothetical protein
MLKGYKHDVFLDWSAWWKVSYRAIGSVRRIEFGPIRWLWWPSGWNSPTGA